MKFLRGLFTLIGLSPMLLASPAEATHGLFIFEITSPVTGRHYTVAVMDPSETNDVPWFDAYADHLLLKAHQWGIKRYRKEFPQIDPKFFDQMEVADNPVGTQMAMIGIYFGRGLSRLAGTLAFDYGPVLSIEKAPALVKLEKTEPNLILDYPSVFDQPEGSIPHPVIEQGAVEVRKLVVAETDEDEDKNKDGEVSSKTTIALDQPQEDIGALLFALSLELEIALGPAYRMALVPDCFKDLVRKILLLQPGPIVPVDQPIWLRHVPARWVFRTANDPLMIAYYRRRGFKVAPEKAANAIDIVMDANRSEFLEVIRKYLKRRDTLPLLSVDARRYSINGEVGLTAYYCDQFVTDKNLAIGK